MKKEVRQLRDKAVKAVVLSIEYFNRPSDRGRTEAVLILLDHLFEMLFKAVIRYRLGKIRKIREKQTIGFVAYVHMGFADTKESLVARTKHKLRDRHTIRLYNLDATILDGYSLC